MGREKLNGAKSSKEAHAENETETERNTGDETRGPEGHTENETEEALRERHVGGGTEMGVGG